MEPYFKLVVIDDDEVAKVKDVRCSSSKHVHKQYELIGQRGPVMHPAAAPGIKWTISLQYKKKGKDMWITILPCNPS